MPRLAGAAQYTVAVVLAGNAATLVGAPGKTPATVTGTGLMVVEAFPSWPLVLVPQQ